MTALRLQRTETPFVGARDRRPSQQRLRAGLDAVLIRVLADITPAATGDTTDLIVKATERLRHEAEDYPQGVARSLAEHGVRAAMEVHVGDVAAEIVGCRDALPGRSGGERLKSSVRLERRGAREW